MKKILSTTLAAVMAVSALPFSANAEENGEMRNITTVELVKDMGIGINLGNTYESSVYHKGRNEHSPHKCYA